MLFVIWGGIPLPQNSNCIIGDDFSGFEKPIFYTDNSDYTIKFWQFFMGDLGRRIIGVLWGHIFPQAPEILFPIPQHLP